MPCMRLGVDDSGTRSMLSTTLRALVTIALAVMAVLASQLQAAAVVPVSVAATSGVLALLQLRSASVRCVHRVLEYHVGGRLSATGPAFERQVARRTGER